MNHFGYEKDKKERHKCWLCNDSTHWPDQCKKLGSMNVDERINLAKSNQVCFSCLKRAGREHKQANCKRRRQCTKTENGVQCTYYHHPLLHKSNAVNIGVASLHENEEAMLPITSADIFGCNNLRKRGNVMFDSGAQASLIRQETADSLGLRGKETSVTITKVGGQEEEINTKVYNVPISAIDDRRTYSVKAIGIPVISNESSSIDTEKVMEQLGLSGDRIRRKKGPIDLLIGIDHAQLHTGPTKQKDHIVARKSPLGWVLFGNKSGTATSAAGVSTRVKASDLAKSVKFNCVFCKRMAQNLETQFMANLPEIRLASFTPPFHHTACDYFGPIVVKVGRNKTAKHYGVLFTCLSTRAVHLELATDCSTMEFLQVLRRFFAIRGTPAVMISDNGPQFVGAEKELKEMVKGWKLAELREFCAEKGMK